MGQASSGAKALPFKVTDVVALLGLVPHPEGGFFVETWRSGAEPMTSRGQTALEVPEPSIEALGDTNRGANSDGDGRRNWLTSIYWMSTLTDPKLQLTVNRSDHVHYWHGGQAFEFHLVYADGSRESLVLGPDLAAGQRLQVCVPGGTWKCGRMLSDASNPYEYSLLGEAVAPGFDFRDFTGLTKERVEAQRPELLEELGDFIMGYEQCTSSSIDSFYDKKRQKEHAAALSRGAA